MADERMSPDGLMLFDGPRMIYGGFETDFDIGEGRKFGYVDGVVASVPDGNRQGFIDRAGRTARFFRQKGARRLVDGWGTDVPTGKVTDFRRSVQAKDGETVLFGWIEWPDKPTRDAGMKALMQDPRMRETPPAWNGQLAIFGGFTPILDTAHASGDPSWRVSTWPRRRLRPACGSTMARRARRPNSTLRPFPTAM
jgi:uncharacterized protein YbaA (DUF1428 family)